MSVLNANKWEKCFSRIFMKLSRRKRDNLLVAPSRFAYSRSSISLKACSFTTKTVGFFLLQYNQDDVTIFGLKIQLLVFT